MKGLIKKDLHDAAWNVLQSEISSYMIGPKCPKKNVKSNEILVLLSSKKKKKGHFANLDKNSVLDSQKLL